MTRFLSMPGSADGSNLITGTKLIDGFEIAYFTMLEAIATNNMSQLGKICEPGLFREFGYGF